MQVNDVTDALRKLAVDAAKLPGDRGESLDRHDLVRARITELEGEIDRLSRRERELEADVAEQTRIIQALEDELSPHDPAQIDALRHSHDPVR